MKLYKDSTGYLKAEFNDNMQLVSSFLEQDVQNSIYGVNEYIKACNDVSLGLISQWEGTGNAHTITITKNNVKIFNEYTEEELNVPSVDKFQKYLEEWKKLILS